MRLPPRPTIYEINTAVWLARLGRAQGQPVTLAEILAIRGKKSSSALKTLLEKKLVTIAGRKQVVGRPILYATSREFLIHFGLKDISELPTLEEFTELAGEQQ